MMSLPIGYPSLLSPTTTTSRVGQIASFDDLNHKTCATFPKWTVADILTVFNLDNLNISRSWNLENVGFVKAKQPVVCTSSENNANVWAGNCTDFYGSTSFLVDPQNPTSLGSQVPYSQVLANAKWPEYSIVAVNGSDAHSTTLVTVSPLQDSSEPAWDVSSVALDAGWIETVLNVTHGFSEDVISCQDPLLLLGNASISAEENNLVRIESQLATHLVSTTQWLENFDAVLVVLALALADIGITESTWDWSPTLESNAFGDELRWFSLTESYHGSRPVMRERLINHTKRAGLWDKFQHKFAFTHFGWTDPSELTQLELHQVFLGAGYDSQGVTVKLALAVISTYCFIAISYVVYTVVTGNTGTSWDSIGELVLLAVNSKPPGPDVNLQNTSAGAATLATFKEKVNVMVNQQGSLEFVFDKDQRDKVEGFRKVEANVKY